MIPTEGDLSVEEFRRAAYRMVDWIAEYFADPGRYSIAPEVSAGEIIEAFPAEPPERGAPLETALEEFQERVLPGVLHWNHPGFMAYFGITGSMPGVLGELLTAALNVNGMLWKTCPAATELEVRVLDWLRRALGLPEAFRGQILDTASTATLTALVAARERITDGAVRRRGMGAFRLRVYTSEQAHSSVMKAAIVAGFGEEGVVRIPTDGEYRLRPDLLEAAIERDRAAGRQPCAIVGTVGTTSTTSVDPVPALAEAAERFGLWLHIDAAYGGAAAILPEYRWILNGCERADSFVVNPHKWLFAPIDCSAFYVRDPSWLEAAFRLVPEYLRSEETSMPNLSEWSHPLGRRFRALKLWLVLRTYGVEGLRARVRRHIALARRFAEWIERSEDFQLMAPVVFSTVCFRSAPPSVSDEEQRDRLNEAILERVNRSGEVYLSDTRLNGRRVLRLAVGNIRTGEAHVQTAWRLLQEAAAAELQRLRPQKFC